MSFYDDLSKPEKKPEPKQYTFTDQERRSIAFSLCSAIKSGCVNEKKNGKRSYHCFCEWQVHEGKDDYGEPYRHVGANCRESMKYVSDVKYCTSVERDKILVLLRSQLAAEGFPADVACAHDHWVGGGLVFNKIVAHIIEVNVRW